MDFIKALNFGEFASLIADNALGRTFDINVEGVAHYGMIPDFLQDLRVVGVEPEQIGHLFLGAEAYIRMWEKACSLSSPEVLTGLASR